MSKIRIITLIHKKNVIQQLSYSSKPRRDTILEDWRHQYGNALRKASITIKTQ